MKLIGNIFIRFRVKSLCVSALQYVLFLLLLFCNSQCQQPVTENEPDLRGLWCFIDSFGNYNEAWFDSDQYMTMNRFVIKMEKFTYYSKNDTLYSNVDSRKQGMNPIASVKWIDDDMVVFTGEFVSDTLYRLKNIRIHLGNTDPTRDSTEFWFNFYSRYESFLIDRGIITQEDAKEFRQTGKIPGYVLDDLVQ